MAGHPHTIEHRQAISRARGGKGAVEAPANATPDEQRIAHETQRFWSEARTRARPSDTAEEAFVVEKATMELVQLRRLVCSI